MYIIFVHKNIAHFWRLIKFMTRFYDDDWTMDKDMIRETIAFYKKWINHERFNKKIYYEKFTFNMLERYVKTPDEHPKRFEIMHKCKFHKKIIPFFKNKKYSQFREYFENKINSFQPKYQETLKPLLNKYGYF